MMERVLDIGGRRVPYEVVRSARRRRSYTLDVRVGDDGHGRVVFLAPVRVDEATLVAFGLRHKRWISNRLKEHDARQAHQTVRAELGEGVCWLPDEWWQKAAAAWVLPRVAWWAAIMGLKPSKVLITKTKSRWGSCTRGGVVRLSCWLMQVPEGLRDYVIVHELAHLRQMNHSPRFWRIVEDFMPDYVGRRRELAKLGRAVL